MTPAVYRVSFLVAAGMLLLAVSDMPWGFYQTLRWIVPIVGVLLVIRAVQSKQQAWAVLGVLSVIFFFPLFGVYLDKQTWAWFDIGFAVSYIAAAVKLGSNRN